LGTEQAKRKLRTRLRLGGQGQGLSLWTTEWIDLQTALRIRSSLQVVFGVVFALPIRWPYLFYRLDDRALRRHIHLIPPHYKLFRVQPLNQLLNNFERENDT
jgi:hypothetical protein